MEDSGGSTATFGQRDRRPDALGCLSVLPDETICVLLEYLAPRDIAHLACVSRFSKSLDY